jgi:acyl carrier protein
MKSPINYEYLLAEITQMLADVLGVEADEISPRSRLVNDLGAESLDFVEFNANIEKRFNLTLPKKSALQCVNKIHDTPALFYGAQTGLTAEGVELLENCLSHYTHLHAGMSTTEIFSETRVENIANLCFSLFNEFLPKVCPSCGHSSASISPQGKLLCDDCFSPVRPLNGDEAEEQKMLSFFASSLAAVQ